MENDSVVHAAHSQGLVAWLTGLSGAGKTTLCLGVAERLRARSLRVEVLDGDEMRNSLCRDLGFSKEDRDENVRRIAQAAASLAHDGAIVLVGAISPYRQARLAARQKIEKFIEVYVNASLQTCITRDTKGLYRRARAGEIPKLTGVDDPYEPPLAPEVECHTDAESVEESIVKIAQAILQRLGIV